MNIDTYHSRYVELLGEMARQKTGRHQEEPGTVEFEFSFVIRTKKGGAFRIDGNYCGIAPETNILQVSTVMDVLSETDELVAISDPISGEYHAISLSDVSSIGEAELMSL